MTDNERAPVSETPTHASGAAEKRPRPSRTTQTRTVRSPRSAKTAKRPSVRTRSAAQAPVAQTQTTQTASSQEPDKSKLSLADFMATVASSDQGQQTAILAEATDQNSISGASFFESIANKSFFQPRNRASASSDSSQATAMAEDASEGARISRPAPRRGRPRKTAVTAHEAAPEQNAEARPAQERRPPKGQAFWDLLTQAENRTKEPAGQAAGTGSDQAGADSSSRNWSAWSGWEAWDEPGSADENAPLETGLWSTARKKAEPVQEDVRDARPLAEANDVQSVSSDANSAAKAAASDEPDFLADLPQAELSEDECAPMDAPEVYLEEDEDDRDPVRFPGTGSEEGREAEESYAEADLDEVLPAEVADAGESEEADVAQSSKRRRRGRRGGKSHRKAAVQQESEASGEETAEEPEARSDARSDTSQALRHNKRRMYISILPGEQVEVAITSNGILDEYYLDMLHQKKLKGNIYRGIIVNIDINLQAAFVDFGAEKNGFLQIDEIHPEYYTSSQEFVRGKKYPPIQNVLRLGQEVLVQVVKEPNGSKGAFLTTWISLAGRFLVLTPGQEQIGISRKVNDEGERHRLRELMNGIDPGDDLGVIVRTVSAGVTQTTLKNDLAYLKRTWNEVRRHATGVTAPACVYREPGLPERAVRDYLTDDVCEIWVDNADIAGRIRDTVAMLFPQKKDLVRVHNDARHSLWERFNLRRQLDQIYSREVLMPSGGRLVFDQTEALMAIDINSGKISCKGNFENMAFKTNMEAAETIARQLKLRDIGGQVVIDFIEMREHKHVLEVERTLRNAMKNDKARHDVARMSSFGLLELVRQRTGTSAISISMEPCPACGGTGLRRNLEWQSLQALRDIARLLRSRATSPCRYEMTQELGLYVLNHKRDSLKELEKQYGKHIEIIIRP